jgi:NADH-quinone oxidoreductase subunit F
MPAEKREIKDCLDEGIEIMQLTAPVSFIGTDKIKEIECVTMVAQGYDSTGRREVYPMEGLKFKIPVDMVIPAVSQSSDLPFVQPDEVKMTKWGNIITEKNTLMTSMEGVFAGGDVSRGSDVVITAIADGKNAATSIDIYLGGKGILNKGHEIEIPQGENDDETVEHVRFLMQELDPEARIYSFDEVVTGFHKLNAIAEAMRCLRCDRSTN